MLAASYGPPHGLCMITVGESSGGPATYSGVGAGAWV